MIIRSGGGSVATSGSITTGSYYIPAGFSTPYASKSVPQDSEDFDLMAKLGNILALDEAQINTLDNFSLAARAAKNNNSMVRDAALSILSRISITGSKQIFLDALKNPDVSVRVRAVNILAARMGEGPEIEERLADLFMIDNAKEVQVICMYSLSGSLRQNVKDKLISYLGSQDEELCQAAIFASAAYLENDPQIFNIVYSRLDDISQKIASQAAVNLSGYFDRHPQLEEPLRRFLKEGDSVTRQGILAGLSRSTSDTAFNIIKPYLKDERIDVRNTAIFSLANTGKAEAVSLMVPFVNDSDLQIRYAVASSLGLLASPEAIEPLRMLVNDPEPVVSQAAINAFAQIPDAPVMELEPFLASKIPEIRVAAIQALSPQVGITPQLTGPFIKIARDDPDILSRSLATANLGRINHPEVVSIIQQNLQSSDWPVRQGAVLAAARVETPQINDLMKGALRDNEEFVRRSVALSLGGRLQKQPDLIEPFMQALKQDSDPFTKHIIASALRSVPSIEPRLTPIQSVIDSALIPGVHIDGWSKQLPPSPQAGVEICYAPLPGPMSWANHTFLKVSCVGEEPKIIGFNSKNFNFTVIGSVSGVYTKETLGVDAPVGKIEPIIRLTISTDPVVAKKLFDIMPSLYKQERSYNLFNNPLLGINCYGARNELLRLAGVITPIPDLPWRPLEPVYDYSRSFIVNSFDPYYSYQLKIQQNVTFPTSTSREIQTQIQSNYQIHPPAAIPNIQIPVNIPKLPNYLPPIQVFPNQPVYRPPVIYAPPNISWPNQQPINIQRIPDIKPIQVPNINNGR